MFEVIDWLYLSYVHSPGALAAKKEMLRICDAIALGGGGIYEMSTDFSGNEPQ